MELLGPRPKPNRRFIGIEEFESGPPNVGSTGGNGWEVCRTRAGEVEYTMTLADSNSPSLRLDQFPQSVRSGQTITFFRLAYVTKAATGGTFRIGKSGPIPYNCTPDELLAQLNLDPELQGFSAVGGPLNVNEIQLCGTFGINKLNNFLVDSTDLLPGAQITAHVGTDKLRAVTHTGDPNEVVDTGDGLAAVFGGLSTFLLVSDAFVTNATTVDPVTTLVYYNQSDVQFTLKYKDYPCRLTGGTFRLTFQVNGGITGKLSSTGLIGLVAQYSVACTTVDLPYNATGQDIATAIENAINLGGVSVQQLPYSGGVGQPPVQINGMMLFYCNPAFSVFEANSINNEALSFTIRVNSNTNISLPWTGTNPGTITGYSGLQPTDARTIVQADSRKLSNSNVSFYSHALELQQVRRLGINCLRLQKATTGYKAICVSEDSQQAIQSVGNQLIGYSPRYGDGNAPNSFPTGTRLRVAQIITIHQNAGAFYGNEPFLALWNTRTTSNPLLVDDSQWGTAWLSLISGQSGTQYSFAFLSGIAPSKFYFEEDSSFPRPNGLLRYWNLYLNFYLDPQYGPVTAPGQIVPKYVYRSYDANFNVDFEQTLYPYGVFQLQVVPTFAEMFTVPCRGLPTVPPLIKFSDGTFGVFGAQLIGGVSKNIFAIYTDSNALQFTKELYASPDPCFTAFTDRPAISHVDVADNIIAVADQLTSGGTTLSPNGIIYVFDKHMHKLRTIQLRGVAIACASDKHKNIYVVTTNETTPSTNEFRVTAYKYAFDGTLLASVVLSNTKFSDMLKTIETSTGSNVQTTTSWLGSTAPLWFNKHLRAACDNETFFVYGAGMKWSMTL